MKQIAYYLLFTFLLTYLAHGLLAYLTANNLIAFNAFIGQLLFILGGSSPTIFGIVFILRNASTNTENQFLSRLFSYKHKVVIWVFAILTPVLIGAMFQVTYLIFKDHTMTAPLPFYLFFFILLISILLGGLEEVGWRGFLQARLMPGKNLILISIVIGIIWALWHIPLFFIESVSHYDYNFLPFLFGAIMFSTYLTWLYAITKSILLVVMFHAAINASASIGFSLIFEHSVLAYLLLTLFTLVGILLIYATPNNNAVVSET